jgi:uncharacterized protein (TIGR03435 family)
MLDWNFLRARCVSQAWIGLALAGLAHGQNFEVATVKPSLPPADGSISINLGAFRGGTLTMTNVTLNDMLKYAYELVSDEQLSGEGWMKETRFDVVAQAPPATAPAQLHKMTQALLSERLHVTLRREQKVLPHLALLAGKGGARVTPSSEPQLQGNQVRGRIDHKQMPMSLLVSLLSRFERQTIVDQTGLTGPYAVKLEWAPDNSLAPISPGAPPPDRPNLFEAVQQQLGLKLESRRAPLDVLVVMQASQVPEDN